MVCPNFERLVLFAYVSTFQLLPYDLKVHSWAFILIYAGTANNAGAILVLGRDLVVVPKLIHPLPPAISSPETSPEHHIEDTWMQVLHLFSSHSFSL